MPPILVTFLKRQWFLLALALVLFLGFFVPQPFRGAAESKPLRNAIVASVLFLMALPLQLSVVLQTVRRPQGALLGSLLNMGLVPLLGWALHGWVAGTLGTGIVVATAAPCTLASAAVWTRRAGGNDVVAIMVTLITNGTCFLFTPMWLYLATRQQTQINLPDMIARLAVLVVLPMGLAQLVRASGVVARTASRHKRSLSGLAQCGILMMVLFGAVHSRASLSGAGWRASVAWHDFVVMVALVLSIHLIALYAGRRLAQQLGFGRSDAIAIAMAGSQKTLMVGLYVATTYFGGLTILPMVAYHVGQLVCDTVVADRWSAATVDD